MVLQIKKIKELTSFALTTALTNQRILLKQGICTAQEWNDMMTKVGNELGDVHNNRENVERMVKRLHKKANSDKK